jgi:single-strand DNA-binding protein
MASFNRVIILGNLTRDPEIKYTPKGTALAQIGIAVNHNYTTDGGEKREETTFIDVELWGRTAEIANEYLRKGRPVMIEGRLKTDTWDDKQTGQKRSKLKVIGENMQLLGGRDDGGQRQERPENIQRSHGGSPPPPQRKQEVPANDDAASSDIPF